jgi:hypothetical protein
VEQDGVSIPETRYARTSDGVHIAYQVTGTGPLDVVMVPGFVSHVELAWDMPFYASMLRRLGSFARVITFTSGEPACRIGRSMFRRWRNAWTTCGL